MKVFVYESEAYPLREYFPEYLVPFLTSNLLQFTKDRLIHASQDDGCQIFLPAWWGSRVSDSDEFSFHAGDIDEQLEQHQQKEYELVVITSLSALWVGDLPPQDMAYIKQAPEKFFSNRGIMVGYLKQGQKLPEPTEFEDGFKNVVALTDGNYLRLNQGLLAGVTLNVQAADTNARVFGEPLILSKQVSPGSTICGPAFIDKDVVIQDSYIGPGTIIRGNSQVFNSRVDGSFLLSASIHNSTISDGIVLGSQVEGVKLLPQTKLMPGSNIAADE